MEPVGDLLRAFSPHGRRDGVAPDFGGLLGPRQQVLEQLSGGLRLDQAAQAEADVPALVELDAPHALVYPGQRAIGQVVEKRVLPGVEDDPLEQHVVEADALAQSLATRGDLGGHRGQPLLEELEHRGRGFGAGRGTTLGGGGSRQSQHLGGDAVEEPRMALLVATLEEEHPGHQALLGRQRSLPGCIGERRDVLGDEIVTDAEAGEERLQAAAALVRELAAIRGHRE